MSSIVRLLVLVSCFLVAVPALAVAAEKKETFKVKAALDEVYRVSLDVLGDKGYRVRSSDKSAGHIAAEKENTFGEKTLAISILVAAASDGESEVKLTVTKRALTVFGGSAEKNLKEFKTALLDKLRATDVK
jgi:hypothetical protein